MPHCCPTSPDAVKLFRLTTAAFAMIDDWLRPALIESNAGLLYFAIWQQPDERFVVKVDNLDAIAPRVPEVAAKWRDELQFVGRKSVGEGKRVDLGGRR